MVRIFEISSDSENENDLHPIIQHPSSTGDEQSPQKRPRIDSVSSLGNFDSSDSYWAKVIAAGNELLRDGIQIGGAKRAKNRMNKEPVRD